MGAQRHRVRHQLQHEKSVLHRSSRSQPWMDFALRLEPRRLSRRRPPPAQASGSRFHQAVYDGHSTPPHLTTRSYVDTGPVVERVFAKYAGVGWIGKNTCIINQKKGSWLFLGVILTSLELAPDLPAPDRCGTCTRCIEACPTNAIIAPYQLDSNKCISYLTIEKRGSIPEDLRAGIGRHVFGCDICQDVCPWNRKAPASTAPEFEARPGLVNPALAWLAEMTDRRISRSVPRIAHPPHETLRHAPQCCDCHG